MHAHAWDDSISDLDAHRLSAHELVRPNALHTTADYCLN